jgi:hypothetical protein
MDFLAFIAGAAIGGLSLVAWWKLIWRPDAAARRAWRRVGDIEAARFGDVSDAPGPMAAATTIRFAPPTSPTTFRFLQTEVVRHRNEHGLWPATLESITARAGLSGMPDDLRYDPATGLLERR